MTGLCAIMTSRPETRAVAHVFARMALRRERRGIGCIGKRFQYAAISVFINLGRTGKAQLRQFGREHARVSGFAGVLSSAPREVGQAFDNMCLF